MRVAERAHSKGMPIRIAAQLAVKLRTVYKRFKALN